MNPTLRWTFCACLTLLIPAARADQVPSSEDIQSILYFDRVKEFPNFFIPKAYRGLAPANIPQPVVDQARVLLNETVGSVFARLTVPVVVDPEKGVENVRIFSRLRGELSNSHPEGRLYPSGGVVRAVLTFLYSEILESLKANQDLEAEDVLRRIRDETGDIRGSRVRGIGGDFDMLASNMGGEVEDIIAMGLNLANSGETAFNSRNNRSQIKRLYFVIGDVKDFDKQMARSGDQGGSTIDLMAYDLEAGRLIGAVRFPTVVDDFLRGVFKYARPIGGIEDSDKQTVRGVRSTMELPWLSLEGEQTLRDEIAALLVKIQRGVALSAKALEQFPKMVRNARFYGAHNRFYRGRERSLESFVLKLSEALTEKEKEDGKSAAKKTWLPEYAELIDIPIGSSRPLNGLPEELLVPSSRFFAEVTNDGHAFHGTPSVENAAAILRGGIFISRLGQGRSAYGRGAYMSPRRDVALGYAGQNGVVFDLEFRRDVGIHVLDWSKAEQHPFVRQIQARAKDEGMDVFEYLMYFHGVDVVFNTFILVQNAEVLRFPKEPAMLLDAYLRAFLDSKENEDERMLQKAKGYINIYKFCKQSGDPVPALAVLAPMFLKHPNKKVMEWFVRELADMDFSLDELSPFANQIGPIVLRLMEPQSTLRGADKAALLDLFFDLTPRSQLFPAITQILRTTITKCRYYFPNDYTPFYEPLLKRIVALPELTDVESQSIYDAVASSEDGSIIQLSLIDELQPIFQRVSSLRQAVQRRLEKFYLIEAVSSFRDMRNPGGGFVYDSREDMRRAIRSLLKTYDKNSDLNGLDDFFKGKPAPAYTQFIQLAAAMPDSVEQRILDQKLLRALARYPDFTEEKRQLKARAKRSIARARLKKACMKALAPNDSNEDGD